MKLWGGRFEAGPSEVFEQFSKSLQVDGRLLQADVRGSQAFARALHRVGILTAADCELLVAAFDQIRADAQDPAYFAGADDEDVHTFVIRRLREHVGALADKIHTGRSRNEQVSLDTRLWLRDTIDHVRGRLHDVMTGLIALGRRYSAAIIPGYTHLRRAQAVLWPHYMLAWFEMFARDDERLCDARRRTNVLPLGSGALAGSGFPFDREAIAEELGFQAISYNSMDVSADRDFALDFLYAASTVMLHISRIAEDWILYSSEEFGWLELSDGVTSGSSLMPQKKNPDSLELLRGKTGRVFSALTSLFVTMKGLPTTYNRDMQEDKEPLFEAADQLVMSLRMLAVVLETTELLDVAPARAAEESWVVATDLAEALARAGTPFHRAHQIVGKLVLESVKQKKQPWQWTAPELVAFAPEFRPEMVELLHPAAGMRSRQLPGGTGQEAVSRALEEAERRLAGMRAHV